MYLFNLNILVVILNNIVIRHIYVTMYTLHLPFEM